MRNLVLVLLCCLGSLELVAQKHEPKQLTAANGERVGFYQFLPANYSTSNKHPVIIFLHGIGERGNGTTELDRVLGVGIATNIKNGDKMTYTWNGKTESFIVLTPQLNSKYGSWQNFYVDEMITYAINTLGGDKDRIYLTGLSLGGGGVWKYAGSSAANANRLAAIVPICATCENITWSHITSANVAVWAYHAKDDVTVGVGCTTGAITNLNRNNPAIPPYMTIWDNGGHIIWDRVYKIDNSQQPNIYEWMLGQSRARGINIRPTIVAPNISTTAGSSATLDASGSKDSDGSIQRYIWKQISGPNTASLSNSTSAKATISGLIEGTYTFEIKIVDDRADWVTQNVTVTVGKNNNPNQAPVANAGSNQTITLPANSVTLNGSASKDNDGTITKYLWEKTSGGTATIVSPNSANTQINNLQQGTYTFRLTVTDNAGATSSATVNVYVNAASSGSGNTGATVIVNAGNDQTITLPANSVTVDGSRSSDSRGEIKKWEWKRISGPSQHSIANYEVVNTVISNLVEGTYQFTLTIWDNSWVPHRDTMKITVLPPQSNGGTGTTKVIAGADQNISTSSTTLDGSQSTDPKGVIKEYRWTKISGPSSFTIANTAAAKTTVSNLTNGTYQFRLTIWDNAWVPYSDTVTVKVNIVAPAPEPEPNPQPKPNVTTVDPGPNQTITLPTSSVTLDGSQSYDPKGSIKRWEWTKISGPASFNITNGSTSKATVNNLVRGTYVFLLTIWDNSWVPYSSSVIVVVKNAGEAETPISNEPVVSAGKDQTITLPQNSVTLDGTGSIDPRGMIKQYQWTKISGPAATLNNATQATATAANLTAGTYQFRLTVWNNDWVPMSDTVTVIVKSATATTSARIITTGAETESFPENETVVSGLKLYPNPATSLIQIEMNNSLTGKGTIRLLNNSGGIVLTESFTKNNPYQTEQLNIAALKSGVYFVQVSINNTNSSTLQFIKQ